MTRDTASGPKLPAMGQWRAIEPTATLVVARAPDFGEPVRAWRFSASKVEVVLDEVERAA
jgi:hypothetical protein